jgi:hypothetical protein
VGPLTRISTDLRILQTTSFVSRNELGRMSFVSLEFGGTLSEDRKIPELRSSSESVMMADG